jgi:hypothetical protein
LPMRACSAGAFVVKLKTAGTEVISQMVLGEHQGRTGFVLLSSHKM